MQSQRGSTLTLRVMQLYGYCFPTNSGPESLRTVEEVNGF